MSLIKEVVSPLVRQDLGVESARCYKITYSAGCFYYVKRAGFPVMPSSSPVLGVSYKEVSFPSMSYTSALNVVTRFSTKQAVIGFFRTSLQSVNLDLCDFLEGEITGAVDRDSIRQVIQEINNLGTHLERHMSLSIRNSRLDPDLKATLINALLCYMTFI